MVQVRSNVNVKVGYIGDRCQDSTGWKTGATTCEDNKYLVEERCLDCPVGTYSNDVADTQCRVKLNDLNIRDAVRQHVPRVLWRYRRF